jgi:hypothetical protein
MEVKELLDDDALDPKKFFNEKEYSTLIINRDGFSKKENDAADLVMSVIDKDRNREESDQLFTALKEAKAGKLLVEAIRNTDSSEKKAKLISACWECGLDFRQDFLFFVELACHQDFQVALEALSVVENIDAKIDHEILAKAVDITRTSKKGQSELIAGLLHNLNERLNAR